MEEPLLPDAAEGSSAPSSMGARLLNLFVTPGQVYTEVRQSPPSHGNWLWPAILAGLAGAIFAWVVFSQPAVLQQIREAREKALNNVPEQQRQQMLQMAETFSSPMILKSTGAIQSVFGGFARPALAALVLWFLGTVLFKADFNYLKALEVAGLASMIIALGKIVAMLLVVITGNAAATLSPALLVGPIDTKNLLHLFLAVLNVFTLWYLAVLSIGLAKLSGISVLKPALCIFGLWGIVQVGFVSFSWAAQRMWG
ncbi:MAG TPA: YIP1 family protein [Candidatus Sulfotelmatobacter sp.]|nr:YIP1 family protein [Candidatus Sulfotelmatobacter sp.]